MMSYKMQKNLLLLGLYLAICLAVSAGVGDLVQGFTLATFGLVVVYAVAVRIQKM